MKDDTAIFGSRRGYLNKDFEFFHLKDRKIMEFELHFHDFNKIIVFISGNVTYLIEGRSYKLKPWDILLVSSSEIHKAIIGTSGTYERMIMWVNSNFLIKHSSPGSDLLKCFDIASKEKRNILRLNPELLRQGKYILSQLKEECRSEDFGSQVLKNSLFLQFIVYLNRVYLKPESIEHQADGDYDESIGEVIRHINENICEDMSIEGLASKFYMSKYHLMHKFKSQTGYTIHSYILQKRLMLANTSIKSGKSITEVCAECGFGDYSSFVRAFKRMYGLPPKKHIKMTEELERLERRD
ncbi:MAG: AraC family transcriptional regulator [Clostridiaceae bacterium]|jgi:AraC-like DNA-binding protein|nr:AraC family transcriptional regulator [Clostridiaceae bacterium]